MGSKHVCASVLSVADDMMALPAGEPAIEECTGPAMFQRILAVGASQPKVECYLCGLSG